MEWLGSGSKRAPPSGPSTISHEGFERFMREFELRNREELEGKH